MTDDHQAHRAVDILEGLAGHLRSLDTFVALSRHYMVDQGGGKIAEEHLAKAIDVATYMSGKIVEDMQRVLILLIMDRSGAGLCLAPLGSDQQVSMARA